MKLLILVAIFCGVQVSLAVDLRQCGKDIIEELEEAGASIVGFEELFFDMQRTIEKLMGLKKKCDDIPRSDPPTFLEQKLIDACEFAFKASVTYESGRLLKELQKLGGEAEQLAEKVMKKFIECFRDFINVPEMPNGGPEDHNNGDRYYFMH